MTKLDVIETMTNEGFFENVQEIIDIIKADTNPNHEAGNKELLSLMENVAAMKEWIYFSIKEMIDFISRAYGFVRCSYWAGLDVVVDVDLELENIHRYLWYKYFNIAEIAEEE